VKRRERDDNRTTRSTRFRDDRVLRTLRIRKIQGFMTELITKVRLEHSVLPFNSLSREQDRQV